MPIYKLHYFDGRGRGEIARMLFCYGGIDYEDVRIKRDNWKENKPKFQFGQVPVLEVDGQQLSESHAIYRFIAKLAGLTGCNDFEAAQIDMFVDKLTAIAQGMMAAHFCPADQKAVAKKKFEEETLPPILETLEKCLKDTFFVGGKISLADLMLFSIMDAVKEMIGVEVDAAKYPKITANVNAVKNDPKIVKYLKTRK